MLAKALEQATSGDAPLNDGDGGFARPLDDGPHDGRNTIRMTVTVRGGFRFAKRTNAAKASTKYSVSKIFLWRRRNGSS